MVKEIIAPEDYENQIKKYSS
ncbi:hypothetical protein HCJ58_08270 [Listeria sp. FSL L7-1509]|uniref:Uncharacterized protein n=1 Tax=Listeria immobilis TaxID=2713502 RepID=A0ABR6SWX0_9LIST|nr:hypothetical protein [Listeria immobilis]MBC1482837.1 hypothetical protein [Listeria immobilis]MBC1506963.1 hypothetical protein [Listeria immobilis]MBC1510175.1 hypothetical protein [Listeria immobilis]MBC6303327.1 hypothetical protein [Listeria immobilis]MBC6312501.1 hypothetical protein [Listeria immobilis]